MLPIGTIIAFAGEELDEEWLLCDGRQCSGMLSKLIGNNVPDLRGQFLRGLDPSGAIDPDGKGRNLLSQQSDMFASHTHEYAVETWGKFEPHYSGGDHSLPEPSPTTTGATGGEETRPKNVAVNFFIYAGS